MQENEVTQADWEAADAIVAVQFDNSHAGYHADIAAIVALHRQQAEDAMRERCAAAIEEWEDWGQWYGLDRNNSVAQEVSKDAAAFLRATPPKSDRQNGEGE